MTIASAGHNWKLVVFNKNTRIASRQLGRATLLRQHPREPFTPLKMADPGSFNLSVSMASFERQKKVLKKTNNVLWEKSPFKILKSILGNIFLLRVVILMGVFSAFVYPILLFLLLCRYLQDNKIQKLEKGTFPGLTRLSSL